MKKIFFLVLAFSLVVSGCKNKDKKEQETANENQGPKVTYTVKAENTKVSFTAYKTTDKTPVGGTFTTVKVSKNEAAASPLEALNGVEFSIPVSSLFTKDSIRDGKLKQFFFGVMDQTEMLSGFFKVEGAEQVLAYIKMNGVSAKMPMSHEITDRKVVLKGVMELSDWNALGAVKSINDACLDLHKGADGVSKTWSEVAIEAVTHLQ
ncbi:MAG: YceI family protein [Flavobacteriaceae bacterium]|nr:YceI family protein [Flavobacteriaceae bacterium]